jgi:hypothetical protein
MLTEMMLVQACQASQDFLGKELKVVFLEKDHIHPQDLSKVHMAHPNPI